MYNVILMHVCGTTVAVSSKKYCIIMCVCSLRYPACNAHASNCQLWPARLYIIFPHYLINGMVYFLKKLLNEICAFDFLFKLSEIFLI
jgi:hypothetical protein